MRERYADPQETQVVVAFVLETEAPSELAAVGAKGGLLFHMPDWQHLLERSFNGARSVYAADGAGTGAAFTIFRAGPFRVGYLGFPVGGLVGAPQDLPALLNAWLDRGGIPKPVCIRIPVSPFSDIPQLSGLYEETPETAIIDLPDWNLRSTSTNTRRDLRKAERANLTVEEAAAPGVAEDLFRLYKATITRHRGSLRYSRTYFRELTSLAAEDGRVRVLLARHGADVVGFNVSAVHGQVGYYLHGSIDMAASESRPGAPLMHEAISWAQRRGCQTFNLLRSPADQPSLVRYKEKWGGVTRTHRTYTLPLTRSYRLFSNAKRLYGLVR